MKTCRGCGHLTVDPDKMPRYDILNPEYDLGEPMDDFGPYDAACFADTFTGKQLPPTIE